MASNLAAAARELLRLKDLKTDAEAINTSGDWSAYERQRDMLKEHDARKDSAWDALRRALHDETSRDAEDAARWRFAKEQMCYSFDGQDRTHYMKAQGREDFEETIDRRRDSPEKTSSGLTAALARKEAP